MPGTFGELTDFFDPDLYLPIRGKKYRIPAPDAETQLRQMNLFWLGLSAASGGEVDEEAVRALDLDDQDEAAWWKTNLGPAYQEMRDDGLPLALISHAAQTAFMNWTVGAKAAEAFWRREELGAGKAVADRPRTATRAASAAGSSPTGSRTATRKGARSTTVKQTKRKPRKR